MPPVCKRVTLGLVLFGTNAMLFYYNLKSLLPSSSFERSAFRLAGPAVSQGADEVRSLSPSSLVTQRHIPPSSWPAPKTLAPRLTEPQVQEEDAVTQADRIMAYALLQNTTQILRFRTSAWRISMRTLTKGQELPYPDKIKTWNLTHGEYSGSDNTVFLSPCSAQELHAMDIPFGNFLLEKAAFLSMNCSKKQQAKNTGSKLVVVYMNLRESGYFGHAIDNVLPRVYAVVGGARSSGHKVSVVLPPLGRRSMSENTKLLCKFLGLELLQRVPLEPHRVVGVSGVAAWSWELRQALQRAIWTSPLLKASKPALCQGTEVLRAVNATPQSCIPCNSGQPGVFLSRHGGTRNSRPVAGAEHLEDVFRRRGFATFADASAVPLHLLAQDLYGACRLAGFSGTAMANLIFLPPQAAVAEFNPYLLYANYWQWSHALGFCYCQVAIPQSITAEDAAAWARKALAEADEVSGNGTR